MTLGSLWAKMQAGKESVAIEPQAFFQSGFHQNARRYRRTGPGWSEKQKVGFESAVQLKEEPLTNCRAGRKLTHSGSGAVVVVQHAARALVPSDHARTAFSSCRFYT
jgi:hypothetical protein